MTTNKTEQKNKNNILKEGNKINPSDNLTMAPLTIDQKEKEPVLETSPLKEELKTTEALPKKQEIGANYHHKAITFAINAPNAKSVMLGGDFNNWEYKNTHLIYNGKDKLWKKEIILKSGLYEYKYIVDGVWTLDPRNQNKVSNKFGSENSFIEIK